jgi:hypothetical protein
MRGTACNEFAVTLNARCLYVGSGDGEKSVENEYLSSPLAVDLKFQVVALCASSSASPGGHHAVKHDGGQLVEACKPFPQMSCVKISFEAR